MSVIDAYNMEQVFNVYFVIELFMGIFAQNFTCFQLTMNALNFIVFFVEILIIITIMKTINNNRKNSKNYNEIKLMIFEKIF